MGEMKEKGTRNGQNPKLQALTLVIGKMDREEFIQITRTIYIPDKHVRSKPMTFVTIVKQGFTT